MQTEEQNKNNPDLHTVLERYIDSRDGYVHAADLIDEADLSAAFLEISAKREKVGKQMAAIAGENFREAEKEGTIEAAAHRWWMAVRDKMTAEELYPILSECIRGEKVLAGAIRGAIEKTEDQPEKCSVLKEALAEVEMAIEHFESAIQSRGE